MHGWALERSGHERNFWVGYHFACAEMATGRKPLIDH